MSAAAPGTFLSQARRHDAARRSAASVACSHCGLAVPAGLVRENAELQFCCRGCEAVYEVIHGCGLEQYYRLRDPDAPASAARPTGRAYSEFDDPAFESLYVSTLEGGLRTTELFLEGVHCAACVWLVEKLPSVLPGIAEARLDFRRALLRITWRGDALPLSRIARTLDSLGYPPHPARDADARVLRRADDRRLLVRIAVAGAIAANVMLAALALYCGMFGNIEAHEAALFRWLSMVLGVISLAWPGSLFFRGAVAALRTRTAHLDLPIALGLAAGGIAGVVNVVLGRGEIYFDSLCVLVFALLVGRWVQRRQQRWAADAVELLYSLTPSSARRVEDGGVRDVPIEAIRAGDLVEVRAGDTVPVDGIVERGDSSVDQALLTGEATPIRRGPGDAVSAGTINLAATLRVRTRATGAATRVGRLMELVENAAREQAPIVRAADRIAGWFTIIVVLAAALTFAFWSARDVARAIDNAVALLIVACPCALGLATPLAVAVAIGRAAKRGILIKGGEALERLACPGTLLLDKTGTLTQGRTRLVEWTGDAETARLVAAVERHSSHPIALALVQSLGGDEPLPPARVRQTLGAGIEGEVDDHFIVVGAPEFVRARVNGNGSDSPAVLSELYAGKEPQDASASRHSEAAAKYALAGLTPLLVAVDGRIAAAAALGDPLREDAKLVLDQLRVRGWNVGVLSGDHPEVVARTAGLLGIPRERAHGGVSPEAKLAAVKEAASIGSVVMVGDGVNDAAALSAATVGIAVHGGAEASLAAADVYLSRGGLTPIVELFDAGRRTCGVIRRALALSLCYNALGVSLAAGGVLNPLIAAVLMPISSLSVLGLALAVRTFPAPSATRV